MSNKKRKKSGCGCFLTAFLATLLAGVIAFSSGAAQRLNDYIMKLVYPIAYQEEILEASDTYGFEPEFICAVIYTESGFEPEAESSAGARGLMQIMPETFLWLVERRGEDYTEEDMLTPEVSLDYGCYYLSLLTEQYDDKYTALAAYNAGNVVREWLSDERYSSDGITLDTIPYEETSKYVSGIKDAEEKYRTLYFSDETN